MYLMCAIIRLHEDVSLCQMSKNVEAPSAKRMRVYIYLPVQKTNASPTTVLPYLAVLEYLGAASYVCAK